MKAILHLICLLAIVVALRPTAAQEETQPATGRLAKAIPQLGDADYPAPTPSTRHTEKAAHTASDAATTSQFSPPETVILWPDQAPVGDGTCEKSKTQVTVCRPAHPNGTAVVICPGGGYGGLVTGAEGTGIAQWLNAHHITGIVLEYRLPHGRAFVPLLDAQRAIRLARTKAKEWGCNPQHIGIMGFSAGGHLASTAATHFDTGDANATDPVERAGCRPDFAVLVYPVITMGEKGHGGSKQNLLGASPDAERIELFSNEKQVTRSTPRTFLAHALDDKAVPPDNSRMFYEALRAQNVPARYLELPSGGHGLNGYKGPMWDAWQNGVLEWLKSLGLIPEQDAPKPALPSTPAPN
jgi:acetyl esterase/lipase